MKEKPILFSGEMVRAILDGRKTQTRRVVKPQPSGSAKEMVNMCSVWAERCAAGALYDEWRCPYGQVGDRLWVRETWQALAKYDHLPPRDIPPNNIGWSDTDILYVADRPDMLWDAKVRPSLFMPRWASRILLEVTNVRIERLQDISEEDAISEGIEPRSQLSPVDVFFMLWNRINGDYADKLNPWVWVIEFKVLEVKR